MTRKCNKCKKTLPIELFSWMSGKSRPMKPVGVCDYCLGLASLLIDEVTGAVEEDAEEPESSEEA